MADPDHADSRKPESLEELFATEEESLLRYTTKLVRDTDLSQEIVQEAFLKLHARFGEVRQPRPWLFTTVHNLALNHLRNGQKVVRLSSEEKLDGIAVRERESPLEQVALAEEVASTRTCLERLDARAREVIRLKFEEDLSYKEISQRTGLSVSNVGYILHHSLKQLASALDKMGVKL